MDSEDFSKKLEKVRIEIEREEREIKQYSQLLDKVDITF